MKFTPKMHNKNTNTFIFVSLIYNTRRCDTIFSQIILNCRARLVAYNARNDTVELARPLRVFIADRVNEKREREREMQNKKMNNIKNKRHSPKSVSLSMSCVYREPVRRSPSDKLINERYLFSQRGLNLRSKHLLAVK